jgi:tyrosyl-tRNA synthetase
MNDKNIINDLIKRCVENVIPSNEKLEKLLLSGKKLNIYLGIDPTSTKIHLGHAVPLRKMQLLSDLGHKVTFLIGDFTAMVGDTSDKESERPILTREDIERNFATYKKQAEKVLDFTKIEVRFNSEWLSKLTFGDVLFLAGHFSVNDFTSRELVRKRLDEGKRVSLPETLYPLMQGYDSYHLDTDIQLGGTDQTFNMQAGRKLNKVLGKKESFIIANGFLPGTDGRKMSKTWGNAVWLDDAPEEIYGKVMSIKDELIAEYFEFGTNMPLDQINKVKKELKKSDNPMEIKKQLAARIVGELYGEEQASPSAEYFEKTVVNKEAPKNVAIVEIKKDSFSVNDLMKIVVDNGLVESKSQFRRLVSQGACSVDDKRLVAGTNEIKLSDKSMMVRVGKRRYLKLSPTK